MANSTTIITDLGSVITNGPSSTTQANAINPAGASATGGAGNFVSGSGNYASGTYYGGVMDYVGNVNLALAKARELAVLIQKILVNTDFPTDTTNNQLLSKILNDLQ